MSPTARTPSRTPGTGAQPRVTASADETAVVFLIGMRINRLRHVHRWLPVVGAMPRMLRELERADLGLLDARTYVSGRVLLVVQYWASFEALESYARAADHEHLPAWRAFNRRVRAGDSVGIYHETYVVPPAAREAVYVHMPLHGLAAALGPAATGGSSTARQRLGRAVPA